MEKDYECVILGDGDYPTHPVSLGILQRAKFLCCCDGAGAKMIEKGIVPDAIVGDGDSLSEDIREKYADIVHIVDEQEYNDLTKCTRFCIEKGYKEIVYLGCTGKREDHTLGNIALMNFYSHEFNIKPIMVTDYGTFTPAFGDCEFESFARQQVSIFNLDCAKLNSEGLKWDAYPYKELWQGTLNEALSEKFRIFADGSYIIYQTHEPKQ